MAHHVAKGSAALLDAAVKVLKSLYLEKGQQKSLASGAREIIQIHGTEKQNADNRTTFTGISSLVTERNAQEYGEGGGRGEEGINVISPHFG